MRITTSIVCLFAIILASCAPSEKEAVKGKAFFDISQFVDQQLYAKSIYKTVERTITLNGRDDKKIYTDFDISNGLHSLKKFNINTSVWHDKYKVSESNDKTTYIAIDSSMAVKKITVERENEVVKHITIDHEMKTLISSANKSIDYFPGKSLTTRTISSSKMGREQDLILNWTYIE